MFPLAGALASPLPQESLNKHNLWKKHSYFPQKEKENNLSLHSHCFVAPFWVIQLLIHHVGLVQESFKMTPKGFRDVSKIKCYWTAPVHFKSTFIGNHILVFFLLGWCFRCQMNHVAVLRSRPLESLNTSLPLSPRLSLWKWLPCGSREVRRWARSTHNPSAFAHNFICTPRTTRCGAVRWMTAGVGLKHEP